MPSHNKLKKKKFAFVKRPRSIFSPSPFSSPLSPPPFLLTPFLILPLSPPPFLLYLKQAVPLTSALARNPKQKEIIFHD